MGVPQYLYLSSVHKQDTAMATKDGMVKLRVNDHEQKMIETLAARFTDGNMSGLIKQLVCEKYHETFKSV